MLDKDWAKSISSWTKPEDVGALNQWLDGLQSLAPVAGEHGLTKFEAMILYVQLQSLNQLASIKGLLENMIDNEMGKGDAPK